MFRIKLFWQILRNPSTNTTAVGPLV